MSNTSMNTEYGFHRKTDGELQNLREFLNDTPGIGNDLSNGRVTSTGSTTTRTLADRFATTISLRDFGAIPLTGADARSTEELPDELDSTAAIQAAIDTVPWNTSATIIVDGYFGIKDTITVNRQDINFVGLGKDQQSTGFKWIAGRQLDNNTKDMFLLRGYRFSGFTNMRICGPACYDPADGRYDERHQLKSIFNLLWRQEEGDRINSTLDFNNLYIGRYDADSWDADFSTRFTRQAKYCFLCEDEAGFNNNGNNDFHSLTDITTYQIDTFASVQNSQNLGWKIKGIQFFWGQTFLEMPKGGIQSIYDVWIGGTNGTQGVFRVGNLSDTDTIGEIYVNNMNAERVYNDSFVECLGGLVKFRQHGGGRLGFQTQDRTTGGYHRFVTCRNTCVASDIYIEGCQIDEDSFSSDDPDFRFRYDTNSKRHRLEFDNCRGSILEGTFEAGSRQDWVVKFINRQPSTLQSFLDETGGRYPDTYYTISYRWNTKLRDGFGRIPLANIYNLSFEQQYRGIGVGKSGVDALTVVESKTIRLRPKNATAFIADNVLESNWRVIGVSANFQYNDSGAAHFAVKSGDQSHNFGQGISNGSSDQRGARLSGADDTFYIPGDTRLRIEGYTDVGLTTPAAFTGGGSDSQTIAVTIHYIDTVRDYLDTDEYNKLSIQDGV